MPRDLKLVLTYIASALVLAQLLALTGILPSPFIDLWLMARDGHAMHNLGSLGLHFALMLACVRPGWRAAVVVLAAGSVINLAGLWVKPLWGAPLPYWINSLGFGYGIASLACLGYWLKMGRERERHLAIRLLGACGVLTLYVYAIDWYLPFTAALHPLTFDYVAYKMDGALGFQPSVAAAVLAQSIPHASGMLFATYVLLPYGFSLLYALHLRQAQSAPVSMFVIFTVSATCALVLYHLCPISGPRYAFGTAFPLSMPDTGSLPLLQSFVPPAARNGMPSWHVGWALILWLNARHCHAVIRAGFALFLLLTILATLGTGEHYLVDVIAGFPAAIAVQAACSRELPWNSRERWRAVAAAAALTMVWILAVRIGAAVFVAVPGLMWIATLATGIASALIFVRFARAAKTAVQLPEAPQAAAPVAAAARRDTRYIAAMFALSGFAALVYQVLFSKSLALTFGSQATATYTVLSVYMGGMALGAWLGGRLAQRRADPLKLYAWCELGIGAYCLATPLIFGAIQWLYVAAAAGQPPDAGALTALRLLLGVAALTVPTVLMGMTLPVLARFFEQRTESLGGSVALLYGMNTLGAAFGALLAGYLVIPALGVWKTTLVAALMNFLVVWLALRLHGAAGARMAAAPAPPPAEPGQGAQAGSLGWLALVILGVGGVVTLALEVNYIHLLAVVAGNSVYAFSLMLFTFLVGLGAGAEGARWLLRLKVPLPLALAWLQFALAAVVLGGVFLWQGLPDYFASYADYPMAREFGAREVVRGVVCFTAMFPPAFVIGAIYPLAMECVGRAFPGAPIAALGRAAALNTTGNIVGVLAAGFWLLPAIGALRAIQLLALLSLTLGVAAMAWTAQRRRPLAWAPAALAALLLAAQPRSLDYTALASGANVYFAAQGYGRVIDHAESVDGGLTTVNESKAPDGGRVLTLLTNGKFQGNNTQGGEMVAQVGFALSPLLHTDQRERALVIGYGTGMSARILHEAGFRELEIADLSADIVRLADEHFGDANAGVSRKSGVRAYITDGRNFLLLQDRSYDVIGLEISSIWFAGAASLYNREFYQLVKRRLTSTGVLQQWMQLHHIYSIDMLRILGSVRAEFRYVWLYLIGGQGMIIASNSPAAAPRPEYVERIEAAVPLAPALRLLGGKAGELRRAELLDPAGIDRFIASFGLPPSQWVSTDDNLVLEYSTPRGNVLDGRKSLEENVALFRRLGVSSSMPSQGRARPHEVQMRYELGLAYADLGRAAEAIAQFGTALDLSRDSRERRVIEEALRSLASR